MHARRVRGTTRRASDLRAVTLRVHTARLSYVGVDRLDITRAGADAYRKRTGMTWEGAAFAPSWSILRVALKARSDAEFLAQSSPSLADEGRRVWDEAWSRYTADFTAEMKASYRSNREVWRSLLARDEVTLVCFCTDAERCHRRIVAELLAKCGAVDCGER